MKPRTPLDDVEFLASSSNRVEVLQTLTGAPATRSELHDETGISQPTLGRILEGFLERDWIAKSGRQYRITRLGSLLTAEFGSLLDTVETVQKLEPLVSRLPTEEMEFDFRLFREATITTPRSPDVFAYVRRVEAAVDDATRVRWLGGNVNPDSLPRQRELVLERGQVEEVILTAEAFAVLTSQPDALGTLRELLETDNMAVYRYDGEIELTLGVVDDVAMILPYDDHKIPCALIETENETVRRWVSDRIDDYRDRSERVTLADLSE